MKKLRRNMNPLLNSFDTPFGVPPFEQITVDHFKEAFEVAIREAYAGIDAITAQEEAPDFANTVEALENSGELLDKVSEIFFNLNIACTSKEMQALAMEVSPELTSFSMYITLNEKLFQRVRAVKENPGELTVEQQTLLENSWRMFVKGGANLEGEDRERFKKINSELSVLSLKFSENSLTETNDFILHITDPADLSGLPEGIVAAAATEAEERKMEGWVFTLHAPSYMPFMSYADNRELRKRMYMARAVLCFRGNGSDNREIVRKIANLRLEKAKLLGYATYADYVLEHRMASSVEKVNGFLDTLLAASYPYAQAELHDVEEYAEKNGLPLPVMKWDWSYYSNKLRQERFSLNDELLRPYFKLENVIKGVFGLATKLYGITFRENREIPKYHEDVNAFEVYDGDGSFLAVLYTDFFPRSNKESGAWMTEYRVQHIKDGKWVYPIISLVMNFTKPSPQRPSLLTHGEVTTFLHEFGHALHGIFSRCTYGSIAGTNVQRDFVELPSQLMENWGFEKEWLDTWAVHYETGEPIPADLLQKIKDSANFHSGYKCVRQLSFGIVDMAWHTITEPFEGEIDRFEKKVMSRAEVLPEVENTCFCVDFGHIFSGGYAAGYYSYKWAEVLDADAFSLYSEKGLFNREIAGSFRKNVLERGGSEDAMILYRRFRGGEPTIDALLKRDGMLKP